MREKNYLKFLERRCCLVLENLKKKFSTELKVLLVNTFVVDKSYTSKTCCESYTLHKNLGSNKFCHVPRVWNYERQILPWCHEYFV